MQMMDYFDTGKINMFNLARGGRSSRTFQTKGHWDKVLEELKPGDFLLIQFGHNDGGIGARLRDWAKRLRKSITFGLENTKVRAVMVCAKVGVGRKVGHKKPCIPANFQ